MTAILNQIRFEREGYSINRFSVHGCVEVLNSLEIEKISVYKRDLEPAILRESEAFYKAEGIQLLDSCDAPEILRRVSYCPSRNSGPHYPTGGSSVRRRRLPHPPLSRQANRHSLTKHIARQSFNTSSFGRYLSPKFWT